MNQSNINGEKLQNYPFPFCSIAEQKVIVNILEEKLSIIEQNEKEINDALVKAGVLRQSILKKAFSGQLVSQFSDDRLSDNKVSQKKGKKVEA